MSHPLLALVLSASLLGTPQEGEAWLREAEKKLYEWPDPGVLVRFQVKTDVIAKTVDALRKQLPPNPTPDMIKAIDALRRIEITGTLDTATGRATTTVDLPLDTSDPERKEGVEKMKQGIETMVTKSFEGLPLSDASLVDAKAKILEATDVAGKLSVQVAGRAKGEATTIRLDRARMLPEAFETAAMTLQVRYIEVLPGRFAPSRLDVQQKDGKKSTASYTYQRVGDLVFPAAVSVSHGGTSARIEFVQVRADPVRG